MYFGIIKHEKLQIKYHLPFRLITGILGSFILTHFAFFFNDFSIIFTGFFYYFVGTVLTIRHREYRIFQIAYSWLIIFSVLQAWFFYTYYHQLFDLGGDDKYFFEDWILLGYTDLSEVLTVYNPYKTFVLPSVLYLKFINFIGFNSLFSFHINIFNVFFASFIPLFVYKTALIFVKPVSAQIAAFFVLFYPFFNYQCVKIIRDVDVYLLFTIFIYYLSSSSKLFTKLIWGMILSVLMFNVRKEAVFYMIIFVGAYLFLQARTWVTKTVLIFLIAIVLVSVTIFLSTNYGLDFDSINRFSELYDELRAETAGVNSLATTIKNAGFLGKIISIPYVWLSPLPPPILFSFNAMTIVISFGCLAWYYLMPRGGIQLYFEIKNSGNLNLRNLALSFSLTIIFGSILISYTSGDPRHTMIFFPIFSIFCIGYFENQKQKIENIINDITAILLLLAIISYSFLKF